MTSGANVLKNAYFLVTHFFVLHWFPGNNSILCFSCFSFQNRMLGFFQLVAGVHFHPVNFVLFVHSNILFLYCSVDGVWVWCSVGVEIVIISFRKISSLMGVWILMGFLIQYFLVHPIGWPESDTLTDRLVQKMSCMLNRTSMCETYVSLGISLWKLGQ